MLYGAYLSAAGMARSQQRQDVIANNLANVNTVGFKRDLTVSRERLPAARGAERHFLPAHLRHATGGAFVDAVQTDFSPGSVQTTNRNLDVAISGTGFLTVQDGSTVRMTRDGQLAVVEEKLVRQIDGKSILDDRGREIELPDVSISDLRIDAQGQLWNKGTPAARLGVVDFDRPQDLVKVGANLFDPVGQPSRDAKPQILSGALETSTVDPAREMVEMLKNARMFQLNAEMISLQDQSLARLVSELPKL